jgi:hypothetical protein
LELKWLTILQLTHTEPLFMERRTESGVRVKYGLRSGSESSSSSVPVPEASGSDARVRYGLPGQSSSSADHVVLPASPKRKAERAELTSGDIPAK